LYTGTDGRTAGRVMVTGAAGFIGSHLVAALLERGHEVIGIDRREAQRDPVTDATMDALHVHPGLRLVTANLSDVAISDLLVGCGTVFHLAAVPGVRGSWGPQFADYADSNITATQRLLAASEAAGVRKLVFASSSSVYGPAPGPNRETDETRPLSPYGVSKLAAEKLCMAYARRPGTRLGVAALRLFTVYGPRQRPDMLVGRLLSAALNGTQVTVYGDGTARRDFTFVDDVVAALISAGALSATSAMVNIGTGRAVALRELITLAEQVTGRTVRVAYAAAQDGDVPATCADISCAHGLFGYQPRVSLEEGLARHAAWLADQDSIARGSLSSVTAKVGR
jgi:nucleoside-diphosphate-sugar epimerase